MIPLPYRLMGILVLVLALFAFGYFCGRHAQKIHDESQMVGERLTWMQAVVAGQQKIAESVQANDDLKTNLEVQHAQANNALNVLLSHPADRVQLPTTCMPATASGEINTTSGGELQAASTERTPAALQEAFDRFTEGMEADSAEWSRALNACSVVMGWAQDQR